MLQINTLLQQLVRATLPQTHSLLPNDLKASVRLLTFIIEILENNYNGSDINEVSGSICNEVYGIDAATFVPSETDH